MRNLIVSGLTGILASASNSVAQPIQIQCGALAGHSYYAEENFILRGEGGWHPDKIEQGQSVITLDPDTLTVKYQYKDATGLWKTVEDQGGELTLLTVDATDSSFQFLILYANDSVEVVTIAELKSSQPKMLYYGSRNGPEFTSAKLLTAKCEFPKSSFGN